jgi:lysophospholipase L1-like esterase
MAQSLTISTPVKFLALGDSYTIGERVDEHERWPNLLMNAFRQNDIACNDLKVIATTGWRTDQLKKAIQDEKPEGYTLVSLLIGVNNQYQGKSAKSYAPEFEELLRMGLSIVNDDPSKIFVLSIPDYGYTPFGKENQMEISVAIDKFNKVNKAITKKYNVAYFDITRISRRGLSEPDLVAADGLHPSAKMYSEWVALLLRHVNFQKK